MRKLWWICASLLIQSAWTPSLVNILADNAVQQGAETAIKPYNLPVIPLDTQTNARLKADKRDPITGKFIPRLCWIAVRNASEALPQHYLGNIGFIARNNHWKVNFQGNKEKDAFMREAFHDSSFLWAYEVLNPLIGTAKAELWRLGVLYVHGGMYMDDDANIGVPLDEVVRPNDKFIVGKESYDWTDMCYRDEFPLSNHSLNARFGSANHEIFFDNR